jgi:hypothetical protein
LGDADALLESARYSVQLMGNELLAVEQGSYTLTAAELELTRRRIAVWQSILRGRGVDAGRARPIVADLEKLLQIAAEATLALPR